MAREEISREKDFHSSPFFELVKSHQEMKSKNQKCEYELMIVEGFKFQSPELK